MINPERIKALCHPEVFKRIPVGEVEKLRVRHIRNNFVYADGSDSEINSRGGFTEVEIHINGKVYIGETICSEKDNYCKKTGRELAFKRAIRQYWDSLK